MKLTVLSNDKKISKPSEVITFKSSPRIIRVEVKLKSEKKDREDVEMIVKIDGAKLYTLIFDITKELESVFCECFPAIDDAQEIEISFNSADKIKFDMLEVAEAV